MYLVDRNIFMGHIIPSKTHHVAWTKPIANARRNGARGATIARPCIPRNIDVGKGRNAATKKHAIIFGNMTRVKVDSDCSTENGRAPLEDHA